MMSMTDESVHEASSAFEHDSFLLDNQIAKLEQDVSKSLNEIAKVFEMKYRDFAPQFLRVKNLQCKLVDTEKNLSQIVEEAPTKKLCVIRDFIDRLSVLNEMEAQLNTLWLGSSNGKADSLADATTILRLEKLVNGLESDESEAVNDRILPLIFNEIAARKSELVMLMDEFYKEFLQFPDIERVNPGMEQMVIKCVSIKSVSDNLTAMKKLGEFESRLEEFVDAVWKLFCTKMIHSVDPFSLMTFRANEYSDTVVFSVAKSITEAKNPDPKAVFQALEEFFKMLHKALDGIHIEKTPFDCLIPSIPCEKKDEKEDLKQLTKQTYDTIVSLSSEFHAFMKNLEFFTDSTTSFDNFITNYERIFVDRRCHHFVSAARQLVTQPYIHLTEVGSSENEDEEKIGDIARMMDEKLKLNQQDLLNLLKSTEADKFSTKLFQFQKCKISTSTFKFVHLLNECLLAAVEADSEMEACRLLTTARNMVEIFLSLGPLHHQQALTTVPQIAAIFFNNCHYLCNRLVTVKTDLQQRVDLSKQVASECNFVEFFADLRTAAANILEQHITQSRRQLSATIGSADIFVGLRDDATYKQCERVLNACAMQIGQISGVWREIMPEFVLAHTLGCLISHLLTIANDMVLAKEDVAASDADIMVSLLTELMQKLKTILTINGVEVIHRVCEEPYFRLTETIFCLNASLAEIGHRWCEGKGH
uniref:Uncharacterized protein n=1 Tax=Ditylenchus dipsaci TaxID=166011 RepID=A0A915E0D9_9BILA